MIYINDYGSLRVPSADDWDLTSLIGRTVTVTTSAGDKTGVAVSENPQSLTIAYSVRAAGGRHERLCVIGKKHIISIDIPML